MSKYSISNFVAHTKTGRCVLIPDEVAGDQKYYDDRCVVFPVVYCDNAGRSTGRKARAQLDGDAYGLHTSGTGDPIVRIV